MNKYLKENIGESIMDKQKSFQDKIYELFINRIHEADEEDLLLEKDSGVEFYQSLLSRQFEKKDLFRTKIPIEVLNPKKFSNPYAVSMEIDVPIDMTTIEKYIQKFIQAMTADQELYMRYKKMANWYSDFNKLIFDSMSESDACLFLTAAAYCSTNTALDVNIIEAAKLFRAVKTDFNRGNAGQKLLDYIARNVNSIDDNKQVRKLKKLIGSNSSYLSLLSPKKDPTEGDTVKEISVSQAKLTNFNQFVLYYLNNGGKIKKEQLVIDIKNGTLPVGGTKVYSFLINLIDPEVEWETIETPEVKGMKIQPATIDRWMVRMFFGKTLNELTNELVKEKIIDTKPQEIENFKNAVIMDLFKTDVVRQNIVERMNELILKYKEQTGLKAHQLQAFGWVMLRGDANVPSADFSSFEDVMNFTQKVILKIDQINPALHFIKTKGEDIKSKTLSAIKFLSAIPRANVKSQEKTEKSMASWLDYAPNYSEKEKIARGMPGGGAIQVPKYLIELPSEENGMWTTKVKFKNDNGKAAKTSFADSSKTGAIQKAKEWIRSRHSNEVPKTEFEPAMAAENIQLEEKELNEIVDDILKEFFK
jgi:hypothetical protein